MAQPVAPAIVIAAHNRPVELERLCRSVVAAKIPADTPLIISIDGGGQREAAVRQVAEGVAWPHGPLVLLHKEHQGLVDHFFACGDLTETHGAVILLEDDLIVGSGFYDWAVAALDHGQHDDRIAGVSLAAPFFDGYQHLPFEPVLDGSDAIFAQVPWYDGMAWTATMWKTFRETPIDTATPVHRLLQTLDGDEWFPDAIRYLVQTSRYYLLPRHAHATNSGAAGAHFDTATDYFQVPLTLRSPNTWRLHSLADSLAIYDDHLELTPTALNRIVPELVADTSDATIAVDLLGTRDLATVSADYLLTTRLTTNAIRTWGASLHPLVANVSHDVAGDKIRLARRVDVIDSPASSTAALATLRIHASRGQGLSTRDVLRQAGARLKARISRG